MSFLQINESPGHSANAEDSHNRQSETNMEEENDDYAPHICFSDAEDIQFYGAGGFHPTHIGDKFDNNRYEIVHKLGYGASATVWLALDHTDHRLVALKIIAADLFDRTWEVNALEALAAGEQDHPGRRAVPKLLKRFDIQGPNGHHHCLVLEVAGCNLIQSMRVRAPWQFPLDVARAMVSELIQGLDYIHSCGVVHGDMHLKNFLLFSPVFDKDSADVEQLYNHVGTPITVPVRRANGIINLPSAPFYSPNVPRYCVPPIEAHRPGDSVTNAKIVINDFSRSFPQRERHAVRTPVRFLAPETMFEGVSGQPADVWGLACSIFEILGDFHLFPVYGDDWDELIMMMIRTIGWIPDDWWRRWTTRGNYFRDDGTFIRPTRFFPTRFWVGLGVRIVTMRLSPHPGQVAFGREEIDALEDMLKGMMRYRPWHRSTASEAAMSRWMQEWSRVGYFNGH